MVWRGVKNFFTNLKYSFTPLGTFALGVVIGLTIFVPGVVAAVNELVNRVYEILGGASIDVTVINDSLRQSLAALDWNDPLGALGTILSVNWLYSALESCLNALIADVEIYAVQITEAANHTVDQVKTLFAVLLVWAVFGLFCGFSLTQYLVRKGIAKRTVGGYLLSLVVDPVIATLIVSVNIALQSVWVPSIWITSVLSLVVVSLLTLLEAYLVHGRRRVSLKKVVNLKTVCMLWLTDLIVFLIALAFVVLFFALFHPVVAVFLAIPVVVIAMIVVGLNAESYVKDLATRAQSEAPAKA